MITDDYSDMHAIPNILVLSGHGDTEFCDALETLLTANSSNSLLPPCTIDYCTTSGASFTCSLIYDGVSFAGSTFSIQLCTSPPRCVACQWTLTPCLVCCRGHALDASLVYPLHGYCYVAVDTSLEQKTQTLRLILPLTTCVIIYFSGALSSN